MDVLPQLDGNEDKMQALKEGRRKASVVIKDPDEWMYELEKDPQRQQQALLTARGQGQQSTPRDSSVSSPNTAESSVAESSVRRTTLSSDKGNHSIKNEVTSHSVTVTTPARSKPVEKKRGCCCCCS